MFCSVKMAEKKSGSMHLNFVKSENSPGRYAKCVYSFSGTYTSVCMYVQSMYVCMYACMHACMYVCSMYVYMYVCSMYVCKVYM